MNHIEGFREKIDELKTDDEFYNYFNESKGDKEANFLKGSVDFNTYILHSIVGRMDNLKDKTCLEIGHGGGRLVAAASKFFKNVIGVDIHNQNKKVMKELKSRKINNVKLFQTDGISIPLKSRSVDFVYSMIVFQHMEKLDIIKANLDEIWRVLKHDGMAMIYFGRFGVFSIGKSSKFAYNIDKLIEKVYFKGYREKKNQIVNGTDVTFTLDYAIKLCEEHDFEIIDEYISKTNEFYPRFMGQYGLLLEKTPTVNELCPMWLDIMNKFNKATI